MMHDVQLQKWQKISECAFSVKELQCILILILGKYGIFCCGCFNIILIFEQKKYLYTYLSIIWTVTKKKKSESKSRTYCQGSKFTFMSSCPWGNHETWFGCPQNILVVQALALVQAKKLIQVA